MVATNTPGQASNNGEVLDLALADAQPIDEISTAIRVDPSLFTAASSSDKASGRSRTLGYSSRRPADARMLGAGAVTPAAPDELSERPDAKGEDVPAEVTAGLDEQNTSLRIRTISENQPVDANEASSPDGTEATHAFALHSPHGIMLAGLVVTNPNNPDRTASPAHSEEAEDSISLNRNKPLIDELLLDGKFEQEAVLETQGKKSSREPYVVVSLENSGLPTAQSYAPPARTRRDLMEMPKASQELVLSQPATSLAQHLDQARELANHLLGTEVRSRKALYNTLSCAYDFAVAAEDAPDEFLELAEQAGINIQPGAVTAGVVKLVFGVDYDKTRISEYSTVLAHAQRLEIETGTFAEFLNTIDGGIKDLVRRERQLRRDDSGQSKPPRAQVRKSIAKRLYAMPTSELSEFPREGEEFVLLLARRGDDGSLAIVADVPHELPLVEKAARKIIKQHK